jgi:hypothetical protein
MPQARRGSRKGGRRRERKPTPRARAYIQATFNNTLITFTDPEGNVLLWGSPGSMTPPFKGSRRSTPYACERARSRPRGGHPCVAGGGAAGALDHGRHADPAQWLSAAKEASHLAGLCRAWSENRVTVSALPSGWEVALRRMNGKVHGFKVQTVPS